MRKANLDDVKDIQKLINNFAKKELMLQRPLNELYDNIRDFWVFEEEGRIVACCALHPVWENMAEIKSLAVEEGYQGKGFGTRLVNACEEEAHSLHVNKIFALTFVPDFFISHGFLRGEKESMPHKIWSECIKCPHFPDCDEILMVKEI
jgi:amino-acid N-acetyltransferase